MYEKRLVIKINKLHITFIDLYEGASLLPTFSSVCQTQSDINSALKSIDLLTSHDYTTKLEYI